MNGKSKRIFSGVATIIAALAILTSGALAWYAGTTALNTFSGTHEFKPMANLHDDFDDPSEGGTIDKKIYVENTGDTEVFVRIKLTETWEIGATTKSVVHMPKSGAVTSCCELHEDFQWIMGDTDREPYVYASIKDGVDVDGTKWEKQDEHKKATLVADGLGSATIADVAKVDLVNETKDSKTLQTNVITMEAYGKYYPDDQDAYVGWVYDVDGYAYWSQQLKAGEATGLLLSAVTVPEAGTMDYKYDIKVEMEFVDIKDINAWIRHGTDGERIITTNTDGQMETSKREYGLNIKEGPSAGSTTIEASYEAKTLLRSIAKLPFRKSQSIFEDSRGFKWNVIGVDNYGNVLILATDIVEESVFNKNEEDGVFYPGSVLEDRMRYFYDNELAPELRDAAQGVNIKKEELDFDISDVDYGLSFVDEDCSPIAFALSHQEAKRYFPNDDARKTDKGEPNWLRSYGGDTDGVTVINHEGSIEGSTCYFADADVGVRPALWIVAW